MSIDFTNKKIVCSAIECTIFDVNCDLVNNIYTETINENDSKLFDFLFSKLVRNLNLEHVYNMKIFKIDKYTYLSFYDIKNIMANSHYYLIKTLESNWIVTYNERIGHSAEKKYKNFLVQNNVLVCIEENDDMSNICIILIYDIEKDRIIYRKTFLTEYFYHGSNVRLENLSMPFRFAHKINDVYVYTIFKNPVRNRNKIEFHEKTKKFIHHGFWHNHISALAEGTNKNYLLLHDADTKIFENIKFENVIDIYTFNSNFIIYTENNHEFGNINYVILSEKLNIKQIKTYDIGFRFE